MGLVGGFWSLVLVRLALGAGEGATLPTATRVMGVWVKAGSRGFAQGVTHSFARLGNALTPPLFALLIAAWGWRGSFVVSGLASFLWVAVWFWYFRDNPRDHSGVSEAELAVLPTANKNESNPVPWGRLIRRMMPTTAVYFCYGWTLWVYVSWLPQFFQQGYQLDLKNSALFAGSIFFAGVVGDALGGVMTDTILKWTKSLVWARSRAIVLASSFRSFV
jgi:MFS family permease